MPEYQQRLIEERDELRRKLDRLSVFIEEGGVFPTLDPAEQARLHLQRMHMHGYCAVLTERIDRLSA